METEYETLKKKYYKLKDMPNGLEIYEAAVQSRLNNEVAVKTNILVHPISRGIRKSETNEIFYIPIPQIQKLKETIYTNSKKILSLLNRLPDVARTQIFLNNLIDELQSTNDIEGVHSSKKEIGDVINNIIEKTPQKNNRFNGLVNQYMKFQEDKYNNIHEVKVFRTIYDELVCDEVEEDAKIDGTLFRREGVDIRNDRDEVIHQGDSNEAMINSDLATLVSFMNRKDLTTLEKCFISHYTYEYIHPFYDGNGRTGRFIACSYLSRKVDYMSAINFSSAILKNKSSYYSAFSEMSNPLNKGEITSFIVKMMELLADGQQDIIERLIDGISKLDKAYNVVDETLEKDDPEILHNILFILFQKQIFGNYVGHLTDKSLSKTLDLTRYLLNKNITILENRGLVKLISKNPKVHLLSDTLFEKIN